MGGSRQAGPVRSAYTTDQFNDRVKGTGAEAGQRAASTLATASHAAQSEVKLYGPVRLFGPNVNFRGPSLSNRDYGNRRDALDANTSDRAIPATNSTGFGTATR